MAQSWYEKFIAEVVPGASGIEKIAVELGGFFAAVTDFRMWRSLGWVLLGAVLMLVALTWLNAQVGVKAAGAAVKSVGL